MVDMIGFLIGLIIARIIVAFIRNKTKNSTNISWVFRTIKMSGLKFDLMCRGIALPKSCLWKRAFGLSLSITVSTAQTNRTATLPHF